MARESQETPNTEGSGYDEEPTNPVALLERTAHEARQGAALLRSVSAGLSVLGVMGGVIAIVAGFVASDAGINVLLIAAGLVNVLVWAAIGSAALALSLWIDLSAAVVLRDNDVELPR